MTDNENHEIQARRSVHRRRTVRGQRLLYGSCDYDECLRLLGRWMNGVGLSPGDRVVIGVRRGKLSVRKEGKV